MDYEEDDDDQANGDQVTPSNASSAAMNVELGQSPSSSSSSLSSSHVSAQAGSANPSPEDPHTDSDVQIVAEVPLSRRSRGPRVEDPEHEEIVRRNENLILNLFNKNNRKVRNEALVRERDPLLDNMIGGGGSSESSDDEDEAPNMDVRDVVRGPGNAQEILERIIRIQRETIRRLDQQHNPLLMLNSLSMRQHAADSYPLNELDEIEKNRIKREAEKAKRNDEILKKLASGEPMPSGGQLAPWDQPSTSHYISPFTPIKPSTMHVNDMPDDCIGLLLGQFETLQDLVEKAFVCPRWVQVLRECLRTRQHALKLFDFERNVDIYQDSALMQYNLQRLDVHAGVKQTGDKKEDHIFIRSFYNEMPEYIMHVLVALFSNVKHLVLQTLDIDHGVLIDSMNMLTSVTLLELPDSGMHLNQMWTALSRSSTLRHVHIFYTNGVVPFEVDKMDFLTKIDSFTLDNYAPSNLHAILNRLGPQLRCLQIGPFERGDKMVRKLIKENPEMVANLTQLSVRPDEKSMRPVVLKPYAQCYHPHKKLLRLIASNFPKLIYLDLEFASLIWYIDIMDSLGELLELRELKFATRANGSYVLWSTPLNNGHRQPRTLPNIKTVYLTKQNCSFNDYMFINCLFPDEANVPAANRIAEYPGIRNEYLQNMFAARRYRREPPLAVEVRAGQAPNTVPHLFPGLDEAIFVVNTNTVEWTNYLLPSFRQSMRNWIPAHAWHKLRLYDSAVGLMNETFFGGDAADLAAQEAHINMRNALMDRIQARGAANRHLHHHHHLNEEFDDDMVEQESDEDNSDDDDDDDELDFAPRINQNIMRLNNINNGNNNGNNNDGNRPDGALFGRADALLDGIINFFGRVRRREDVRAEPPVEGAPPGPGPQQAVPPPPPPPQAQVHHRRRNPMRRVNIRGIRVFFRRQDGRIQRMAERNRD